VAVAVGRAGQQRDASLPDGPGPCVRERVHVEGRPRGRSDRRERGLGTISGRPIDPRPRGRSDRGERGLGTISEGPGDPRPRPGPLVDDDPVRAHVEQSVGPERERMGQRRGVPGRREEHGSAGRAEHRRTLRVGLGGRGVEAPAAVPADPERRDGTRRRDDDPVRARTLGLGSGDDPPGVRSEFEIDRVGGPEVERPADDAVPPRRQRGVPVSRRGRGCPGRRRRRRGGRRQRPRPVRVRPAVPVRERATREAEAPRTGDRREEPSPARAHSTPSTSRSSCSGGTAPRAA